MTRRYKFSMRYYNHLCEHANDLNEIFKAEGSSDRAIVLKEENGYEIRILRYVGEKK